MLAMMAGWSHSVFGKLDQDLEGMMVAAAQGAVHHAGLDWRDIDAVTVGHFNAGMANEAFPASLALAAHPDMRWKPASRHENACASGSAALHHGLSLIASGMARTVLVVGVEKMTAVSGQQVTEALARASHARTEQAQGVTFPGIFAAAAQQYSERFGDVSATLARIAEKNHGNGVDNPYAQLRKPFDFDFCNTVSDKNPIVAVPLRRTDCSPVSDGAAALVLTTADVARGCAQAVRFRATAQVNDLLPIQGRDLVAFEGPRRAFSKAFASAGISLADLNFVEVHDCFTIAELLSYEAMGLVPTGQGARALAEGWVYRDGKLPINRSGGLKAKGHPVGATGVSMHVMAAMQLTDTAGAMQLPSPTLAAVFNMGGAAVANYVSVLERAR